MKDQTCGSAVMRRNRRQLLAGGTAALAVLTAEALGRAAPAAAANGDNLVLGVDNFAMDVTNITDSTDGSDGLVCTATGAGTALGGISDSGDGVGGTSTTGAGIHGVSSSGIGVKGECTAGTGVLAAGATALSVQGPAVFSRSGTLTVAAGKASGTVTGVALSAASLVLATLQQDRAGVWVRSAVPNVSGSSFTVHLSKAVTASITVTWFVVN